MHGWSPAASCRPARINDPVADREPRRPWVATSAASIVAEGDRQLHRLVIASPGFTTTRYEKVSPCGRVAHRADLHVEPRGWFLAAVSIGAGLVRDLPARLVNTVVKQADGDSLETHSNAVPR